MPKYFAALTIMLWFGLVVERARVMNRRGTRAMYFGNLDRKDYFIPPFALFYFYLVLARAFQLPTVNAPEFFDSPTAAWAGVFLCAAGLCLFSWSLISFGCSFRVGIDVNRPGSLVTRGAFALSRNPIYVAFAVILTGQFLILPNWIMLAYIPAAAWLVHRQIFREEAFMKKHYGQEYSEYCRRVRRYL